MIVVESEAMAVERRGKQDTFELRERVSELSDRLDGERTQKKELILALAEERRARAKAEEEIPSLTNSLNASLGNAASLRKLLGVTQRRLAAMAEGATGVNSRLAQTELDLSRAREENMRLARQSEAQRKTLEELLAEGKEQAERIQVLKAGQLEKTRLQSELRTTKSQLNIAKSRGGNLLAAGKVGWGLYMLENLCGLPVVGKYFDSLAVRVYDHYYGARAKGKG